MEQRISTVNQVDSLNVGHIAITMTHWDDALEPEIAAGSVLNIGGTLFYATANDDIDVAGAWGGIAISTLVYIYYAVSGTTATAELSSVDIPAWDVAKQGWYNAAMTKRCIGSIYKDAAGDYTQKTIFINREIGTTAVGIKLGITANGAIKWDEALNDFNVTGYNFTDDTLLKEAENATLDFYLKKPISAFLKILHGAASAETGFYIYQHGAWQTIYESTVLGLDICYCNHQYNPGYYRLKSNKAAVIASLYCTGVFGMTDMDISRIVT